MGEVGRWEADVQEGLGSLCGMNRAAEGVARGLGAVLGFRARGWGPRVGAEPGARKSFSSLTCSPPSP